MLKNYSNMFALISDLAKLHDDMKISNSFNWQSIYHDSLKQVLKDSEIDTHSKEKVKKVESLLYTMMDKFNLYSNYIINKNMLQSSIEQIYKAHQVEQRSEQWYEDMKHMLTASEFSSLFEGERAYDNLILSKINLEKRVNITAVPTNALIATQWGIRFEPVIRNYLEKSWNCKIYESGRLKHPTNTHLGASPDGIIIDSNSRFGRLVEIKCPYSRKIGEGVPYKYWVQMQIQMEVTNLYECEYVEVEISSINPKQMTFDLSADYLEVGELYLMEKNGTYTYVYNKDEKNSALEKDYTLHETIPYGIKNVYNVCVKRDFEWYESTKSVQEKFWKNVEETQKGTYTLSERKVKKPKLSQCLIVEE